MSTRPTYINVVADRGDRVSTFQRALHYRQKTVRVSFVVEGQRLPQVKMTQWEANRLVTAYSDVGAGGIGVIVE